MIETINDKKAVLETVGKLPDNISLQQIIEEMEILAALRKAHADSVAGRIKTHAVVGALI